MIFGITLKHFAKIRAAGEKAKASKRTKRLLIKDSKKAFKTKDILLLSLSEFMECEKYFEDVNYLEFCRIFVVKRFWQTIYLHNMRLILEDWSKQKELLKEENDFIFDPPIYGDPPKETTGSELRIEFVERFGTMAIVMDKICKGDMTRFKEVEKWTVGEFFYWGNYISGQRILENIK